jgi:two-component system OmpR family response regulator
LPVRAWGNRPIMRNPKRVLIVEDDPQIAELMQFHLRVEGYDVSLAADGRAGLRMLQNRDWDVLVLDVMLPSMNGLEICRRARAMEHYTPTIITSARGSEPERVLGLETGADDYLAKPFSMLEFVARVKALVRRVSALTQAGTDGAREVRSGALRISLVQRQACLQGNPIKLTPREFDLLYFLASAPGKVFSRSELLDQVWRSKHSGYEHTVNTHINRLRAKIETDPSNPKRILTVWGRGYKYSPDVDTDS